MAILIWFLGCLTVAAATPVASKDANNNNNQSGYKDQFCTDPRTMRKHAAYTEWADAYSCTRHRCQPGGRNLAIYTVGCKRVEAPESAIECEEVVEDTNMQFPFCCTRLRCLVVVRGEVWTRVLGQPWEVLPAAPWSHMYKMKKPPPSDTTFQPKLNEQGPVYELTDTESDNEKTHEKVPRSGRKVAPTTSPDCNDVVQRAEPPPAPAPDIVIALSTNNEKEQLKKSDTSSETELVKDELNATEVVQLKDSFANDTRLISTPRPTPSGIIGVRLQDSSIIWRASPHDSESEDSKHTRKSLAQSKRLMEKEEYREHHETDIQDLEEPPTASEKPIDTSEEKFNRNIREKKIYKGIHNQVAWTDIPQNQWNEHEGMDAEPKVNEPVHQETQPQEVEITERNEEKVEKPGNLQALVDAIGTRMKDIENVVQKMSEKVHQTKNPTGEISNEKRYTLRGRNSKYLHIPTDGTTTEVANIEDNGNYFSDASNAVRRASIHQPKEPVVSHPTYMAPVETHHKPAHIAMVSDTSEDQERKKKKHNHKRKKNKTHAHKKHHNQEKRKHFNKLSSIEIDKNGVSLEDSSAVVKD